jgi:hypothetical protein
MVCIFDPACELFSPWTKELYLCTVAPLLYLLSDLLPPPPSQFYTLFLTRFRTYKIASPPQTKMTSIDDIKGLGSLKFLRPCLQTNMLYNVQCLQHGQTEYRASAPKINVYTRIRGPCQLILQPDTAHEKKNVCPPPPQ